MSHFVRVSPKIILLIFLNLLYLQVNKFYLLKTTLSNKVKVITGSVIGKVELLHQGYKVFTQSKTLKRIEQTNG